MSMKKLRFEPIPRMDPAGGMVGYDIDQMSDEDLLNSIKTTGSPEAKACLIHRYNRYGSCDVDSLLSIAEDYLNGKQSSSVKIGNDVMPTERPIDIDSLLAELEYKGIRVLNIEYNPQSMSDAELGNLGERIVDEMPNTLEYIMKRDHYELAHVKGKAVYKRLGTTYPLRGVNVVFMWSGSHDGTVNLNSVSVTEQDGSFSVSSPKGLIVSMLKILVASGKRNSYHTFTMNEMKALDGDLGELLIPIDHSDKEGLFETLDNRVSNMENVVDDIRSEDIPNITVGEGDDMFVLSMGTAASNYSYKMLNRLIAPEMIGAGIFNNEWDGVLQMPCPVYDRVSVDRPIDIDRFRDVTNGYPLYQIRMGSLGLGYVLTMQQEWRPSGFSLGNLLYSVALAPGEEQRVIVTDRAESYSVSDEETLLSDLGETYDSDQNSDTEAIFNRALGEYEEGSTDMKSTTKGTSAGVLGGLYATGSTTKNTTDSSSSNSLSREQASAYSQSMNESIARQANRQRDSSRMGIRLATSEESSSVTSKIISNHNHSHSLTMQYWEVVKNYLISTRIADVGLVCYIPFELIQFLPEEQQPTIGPATLLAGASSDASLKDFFYTRYKTVIKYFDALYYRVPWKYRNGLNLMKKYSSYLDWDFQDPKGGKLSKFELSISAFMLSFHDVHAYILLKNGKGAIPGYLASKKQQTETPDKQSKYDLIQYLNVAKLNKTSELTIKFEVPPDIQDDDLDQLVIDVRYPYSESYPFNFTSEQMIMLEKFADTYLESYDHYRFNLMLHGVPYTNTSPQNALRRGGGEISLSNMELRSAGPPLLVSVKLVDEENKEYLNSKNQFSLDSPLSFNIHDAKPTMSFGELQEIEMAFQHIVENSIQYSRVIWGAATREERAMLFERYTVALPRNKKSDVGKEIPLANCIENTIVGFYGNCMIVPFSLPPEIADIMGTTTGEIQDALFSYHAESFRSSEMKVALPAGGIVGEAVLGGSNTSEVIDITRFWNWGDSPIDSAPSIDLGKIPDISLLSDALAPNELTALKQQLSLGNIAATSLPDIAKALTAEGAGFHDVTNREEAANHMTTIAEKAAEERMNAVTQSTAVAKTAIKAAANIATGGATGAMESAKGGGGGGAAGSAGSAAAGGAAGGTGNAAAGGTQTSTEGAKRGGNK